MISLFLCNSPHPTSFSSATFLVRLKYCKKHQNLKKVIADRCIAKLNKCVAERDCTGF